MKSRKNKNFEILAIIPARGGSKSIPKKNIKNLLRLLPTPDFLEKELVVDGNNF